VSSNRHTVRLLKIAEQDLQDIVSFVAADNVSAAISLAERVECDLQRLGPHPYLGKTPNDERLVALGYRVLTIDNYLVFYKVRGKTVLIHRILHGARDIPSLLEDM
jgi:toxin ParE1/3/4